MKIVVRGDEFFAVKCRVMLPLVSEHPFTVELTGSKANLIVRFVVALHGEWTPKTFLNMQRQFRVSDIILRNYSEDGDEFDVLVRDPVWNPLKEMEFELNVRTLKDSN